MTTPKIQTIVQTISPKRAGEIMDRHYQRVADGEFKQRPISTTFINKYASDMKTGNWLLSPQPIAFDTNGDVVDGQHRLEAVRKSGKDIEFMVSTGWPLGSSDEDVKLIDVLDTGKPRSISQMMHIHGLKYPERYVGSIRYCCRVAWIGKGSSLTYASTHYLLDRVNLRSAIDKIISVSVSFGDFKGRLVGPLAYYWTAHPVKALSFADELFNHSTAKGSAVHTYFRWTGDRIRNTEEHLKGLCACLRAWHSNSEISMVRPHNDAIEWLSATNTKLRDQIRAIAPKRQ